MEGIALLLFCRMLPDSRGETGRVEICEDGTMAIIDQTWNLADNMEQPSQEETGPETPNTEQEGENSDILDGHGRDFSDHPGLEYMRVYGKKY
ncbi:hypothetical protein NDU88_005702 [Pleurodeles waltl]|uniref:Uncharacterized protein n=1 Tax=Pleurodeles waltl TaxID=8319 RepID=A0AAV7VKM9_PLEWA|nr:hypothetical protein NDU88_005702 [Pleurodeles waltl]